MMKVTSCMARFYSSAFAVLLSPILMKRSFDTDSGMRNEDLLGSGAVQPVRKSMYS
jgi:hypothetical protein